MAWDFGANQVVETVDGVPEQYRPLYVQNAENKFVIDEKFKPLVTDYVGVSKVLNDERNKVKNLNAENTQRRQAVKAYEDLVTELGIETKDGDNPIELLKSHVSGLAEKIKNGGELKVNLENLRKQFEGQLQTERGNATRDLATMTASLSRYLVGREATAAISSEKGAIQLLMPHIQGHCKVVKEGEDYVARVTDDNGEYRMNTAGGFMTVPEFVKELKATKDFARAFDSEAPAGAGVRPGSANERRPAQARPVVDQKEMTAAQKIAAGLKAGVAEMGRR